MKRELSMRLPVALWATIAGFAIPATFAAGRDPDVVGAQLAAVGAGFGCAVVAGVVALTWGTARRRDWGHRLGALGCGLLPPALEWVSPSWSLATAAAILTIAPLIGVLAIPPARRRAGLTRQSARRITLIVIVCGCLTPVAVALALAVVLRDQPPPCGGTPVEPARLLDSQGSVVGVIERSFEGEVACSQLADLREDARVSSLEVFGVPVSLEPPAEGLPRHRATQGIGPVRLSLESSEYVCAQSAATVLTASGDAYYAATEWAWPGGSSGDPADCPPRD